MKNKKLRLLSVGLVTTLAFMLPSVTAHAAPDYEVHNTTETIGGTWASANTDVLIGPAADITINGDWYITANTLYIHPSAKISGTGTIHIMNPSTYYSKTAATTMLDAGSVSIGCRLSLENGSSITLTAINPATSYASAGFTEDASQQLLTDLRIANKLNFNNVNAHVLMGNYNVVFTSTGTITRDDLNNAYTGGADPVPGTAAQAYLVTNGTGVVTKQGLALNSSFEYPVGQSVPSTTTYDYTPATVTNSVAARDLSLQVKNYAGSGATEGNVAKGIDRTWQITGSTAGNAVVQLTNNVVDNANGIGTAGANFAPASSFVTQQTAASVWSLGTPANGGTPVNTLSGTFSVPTSGATSYFSKSSDVLNSLKPSAYANVHVLLQANMPPSGTTMYNRLQTAATTAPVLPTSDPFSLGASYANINNTSGPAGTVSDWVKVQIRSASAPGTILQTRALLLKPDGSIVDVDGSVPAFTPQSSDVRVVVYSRNHLNVMSTDKSGLTDNNTIQHDFTTGLTQAFRFNGTQPAPMRQVNGVWCMWAGDLNQDGVVNTSDYNLNNSQVLQGLFNNYFIGDVNMDGVVNTSDLNITNATLLQGIFSPTINY